MSWEQRDGRRYYYRKKRIGKRVVSEYVGTGLLAEITADIDEEERRLKQDEAARLKAIREADKALDREIDAICAEVRDLIAVTMLATGHYAHKRQWRKRRDKPS
jgi:hypothetical protein